MRTFKDVTAADRVLYAKIKSELQKDVFGYVKVYQAVDSVARNMIAAGQTESGHIYQFPLENKKSLQFTCHGIGTQLKLLGSEETELVSLTDAKNYTYPALVKFENQMRKLNIGIGEQYPAAFLEDLHFLEPGDLLISPKKSAVCIDNKKEKLTLKDICPKTDESIPIHILYEKCPTAKITTSDWKSVQSFWRECTAPGIASTGNTIVYSSMAQELIDALVKTLSMKEYKELDLGPVKLGVRMVPAPSRPVWTDEQGKKIKEENVKIIIAWLNNAPVITTFDRKDETSAFTDDAVQDLLAQVCKDRDFEGAYNILKAYCKDNHGDLIVRMGSYIRKNKRQLYYTAATFTFTDEGVTISEHIGDQLQNGFSRTQPATKQQFIDFCIEKYTEQHQFCIAESREQVVRGYSSALNAELKQEQAAEAVEASPAAPETSESGHKFTETVEKSRMQENPICL